MGSAWIVSELPRARIIAWNVISAVWMLGGAVLAVRLGQLTEYLAVLAVLILFGVVLLVIVDRRTELSADRLRTALQTAAQTGVQTAGQAVSDSPVDRSADSPQTADRSVSGQLQTAGADS